MNVKERKSQLAAEPTFHAREPRQNESGPCFAAHKSREEMCEERLLEAGRLIK